MSTMGSPRTPKRPMAFTAAELSRGAVWAWLSFLILLTSLFVVPTLISLVASLWSPASLDGLPPTGGAMLGGLQYLIIVLVIGGTISGLVTLVAAPLAGAIGRRLAGTRPAWIHASAYLLLGAVVGGAVGLGIGALVTRESPYTLVFAGLGAGLTAPAAVAGWWITMRKALRDDRRERGAVQPA